IPGQPSLPFVYYPYLQSRSNNSNLTLLARHRSDTASVLAAVRREVHALDPNISLQMPMTGYDAARLAALPWRVAGMLAIVFGLVGLALAALGIYGLVAYTVNQRTHEIG